MTTEELVAELIKEIKADRAERKRQFDRIESRLTILEKHAEQWGTATAALSQDMRDFRGRVFENASELAKRIRAVSDFVGMTDAHDDKNGGG